MTRFRLTEDVLSSLWRKCHFPIIDDKEMRFFALRGCLPEDPADRNFRDAHALRLIDFDHRHLRCTIGQWIPGSGISLFYGSTVPYISNVKRSVGRGGKGTNQLMWGLLQYDKGYHGYNLSTGHQAFRQGKWFPVRRTSDNYVYDTADEVEFGAGYPWDNLHAARAIGLDKEGFGSAGCQVLAGYAMGDPRKNGTQSGPWKLFYKNAYDLDQSSFEYGLFAGHEASELASPRVVSSCLRYGSEGEKVSELQTLLGDRNFYSSRVDGDFGPKTLRAVLDFQTEELGPLADDGIVGEVTGSLLGCNYSSPSDHIGSDGMGQGKSRFSFSAHR